MTIEEKQNLKEFIAWVHESKRLFDSAPKNKLHQTADRFSKSRFSFERAISIAELKAIAEQNPPEDSWFDEESLF